MQKKITACQGIKQTLGDMNAICYPLHQQVFKDL